VKKPKSQIKAAFDIWIRDPKGESGAEFARRWGISEVTLWSWKKKAHIEIPEEKGDYDPDSYLANSAKVVDAALIRACERGSPGALKAYYQITNRLVEKSENINIDISGDELTRRNLEAERRLRDMGYGVEDVQEKPPLLPEDVLSSPGQGTQGDNQV